jgi:hypothetical protein
MSRVGFEPTIRGFERAKTFHAATVIGLLNSASSHNIQIETSFASQEEGKDEVQLNKQI